ncbi:hypothetical protein GCM10023317_52480 [Actinopolymorpha pittospori]
MSRELLDVVSRQYGLQPLSDHSDLEDSFNLNVVVRDGDQRLVVRVYRSSTTAPRLEAVQRVRRFLIDDGLPFAPLRPTLEGCGWCEFDGRLIEVEQFVPSQTYMESFEHIRLAMPVLAHLHNRLGLAPATGAAAAAPVANHVDSAHVVESVAAGLAVARSASLSAEESRYAAIAETLSHRLRRAEKQDGGRLRCQLVHGDFWDDNVKFTGSRVSLITDLDFMGVRPRVDDLALTLFYTNERLGRDDSSGQRPAQLRELVDAYDEALRPRLSKAERQALPYAIARTPLCFIAQSADSGAAAAAQVLRERGPVLSWALTTINDRRWTTAFG